MNAKSNRGFSLIEVLVATSLLVVGFAAVAYLLIAATAVNGSARHATQAATLAQEKMEELRGLPIDDGALSRSPPGSLDADVDGFHDEPVAGYRRRWSIAPLPASPADVLVIQVVVSRIGDPGSTSLIAMKTRKVD